MLTKYFKFKTSTKQFLNDMERILDNLKEKKVLLCAQEKDELDFLNKKYNFLNKLNIVALAPFKTKDKFKNQNFKIIQFEEIKTFQFDTILVLSSNADNIINKIRYNLMIEDCEIYTPFIEYVEEEKSNLIYLLQHNFDKTLPKLIKKLKNKKVVIYGAGIMFELIHKYFDLSQLNPIGITDLKFKDAQAGRQFLGYTMLHPNEILKLKPDYILVTTKLFVYIFESLYYDYFDKTKTKIIPIIQKNFFQRLVEIAKS